MKLYLQFGYGMMAHVKHMFKQWDEGTVILSPRDMDEDQIARLSTEIKPFNGKTLFDAQLYLPRSDHHGLLRHEYYQEFGGDNYNTSLLANIQRMKELFQELKRLNDIAQTDKYIIPGIFCDEPDDVWNMSQQSFINASQEIFSNKSKLATLCVSSSLLGGKPEKIESLIGIASKWDVNGFYVVPEGQYLENNAIWFANLLSLIAGLKLLQKEVIVGYSNHQMLALASAGADAIATGSWLNVRHFSLTRFEEPTSTGGRKVPWYYCPSSQSEYKLATLDAYKRLRPHLINDLKTDISMNSPYIDSYFETGIEFKEQAAFRHYFQCMYKQCELVSRDTYNETFSIVCNLQENAEKTIDAFRNNGLRQRERSYEGIGESCITALEIFNQEKGNLLKRLWTSMH